MKLTRYEPKGMMPFHNWMDRWFDDFLSGVPFAPMTKGQWVPAVDLIEEEKGFTIEADLPSMDPKDVHIKLEDNVLTLSGERKTEHESEEEGILRRERSYGSFSRSFTLPETADPEKVKASFRNGVLKIELPKSKVKPAKVRTIPVQ